MILKLLNSPNKNIVKNKPLRTGIGSSITILLLIPLIILAAFEVSSMGSFISTVSWPVLHPREFILSYIIMFAVTNIFYILPRRLHLTTSSIILAFFSILGFISHEKQITKGSPIVPSDLFLAREAIGISGKFQIVYIVIAAIVLVFIFLVFLIIKFIPKTKYKRSQKIAVFSLSAMFLFFLYTYFGPVQKAFALQLINYSQTMNYSQNGMILGFILEAENQKVSSPAGYQQNTINNIVQNSKAAYTVNTSFKPNIIFVMSEAFWDPTLMKNITFSEDPIPFFHSLEKSQTSGTMLSAVYGGGTANTEFEALTGFSSQFLPAGTIAYSQYINRSVEALPTILKGQGYAASAIHTYDNWFYNRNNVYKDFGFDKFITKEFLDNPEYHGTYISDSELTDQILKEVTETSKPDFIYSVSMEDHGPYSAKENPSNTIKASGANLTSESQALLDNYANTIHDVDKSLQQLIEGLQKTNQPTLVVFYGDHLPLLGDNYSVYKDAGFIKDGNSYEDYLSLHSVPFVIWNNFGAKVNQNLRLSANYMGTLALEMAQKSGSPMTDYLSNLMKDGADAVIDPDYQNQEKMSSDQIAKYKDLQYDLLFGNEYTYQLEPDHKPASNDTYIQGDALPKITDASFSGNTLTIQGENFVKNDKLYIDGKEVKATYTGPSSLTTSVSEKTRNKKVTIQVKITDSMNNAISKSNTYVIN